MATLDHITATLHCKQNNQKGILVQISRKFHNLNLTEYDQVRFSKDNKGEVHFKYQGSQKELEDWLTTIIPKISKKNMTLKDFTLDWYGNPPPPKPAITTEGQIDDLAKKHMNLYLEVLHLRNEVSHLVEELDGQRNWGEYVTQENEELDQTAKNRLNQLNEARNELAATKGQLKSKQKDVVRLERLTKPKLTWRETSFSHLASIAQALETVQESIEEKLYTTTHPDHIIAPLKELRLLPSNGTNKKDVDSLLATYLHAQNADNNLNELFADQNPGLIASEKSDRQSLKTKKSDIKKLSAIQDAELRQTVSEAAQEQIKNLESQITQYQQRKDEFMLEVTSALETVEEELQKIDNSELKSELQKVIKGTFPIYIESLKGTDEHTLNIYFPQTTKKSKLTDALLTEVVLSKQVASLIPEEVLGKAQVGVDNASQLQCLTLYPNTADSKKPKKVIDALSSSLHANYQKTPFFELGINLEILVNENFSENIPQNGAIEVSLNPATYRKQLIIEALEAHGPSGMKKAHLNDVVMPQIEDAKPYHIRDTLKQLLKEGKVASKGERNNTRYYLEESPRSSQEETTIHQASEFQINYESKAFGKKDSVIKRRVSITNFLLSNPESSFSQICDHVNTNFPGISSANVSYDIQTLRKDGIITQEGTNRKSFYSIDKST